jgi:hypothetical protein
MIACESVEISCCMISSMLMSFYVSTVWIVVMKRYDSCLLSSATPPSRHW